MTIDEAIELQMKIAGKGSDCWKNCRNTKKHCKHCMAEHEQIAELLEELKELRNMTAGHLYAVAFNMGYLKAEKEARNKAIDDFAGRLIRYVDCGHLCSPTEMRWSDLSVVEMVKKLSEQLKAGIAND